MSSAKRKTGPFFVYSSPTLKEWDTEQQAVEAAERAARDNPGHKFYAAQCAGTVQTEIVIKKEGFNG